MLIFDPEAEEEECMKGPGLNAIFMANFAGNPSESYLLVPGLSVLLLT